MYRQSTRFVAVGLEMGLALFLGIMGGRWLDTKFETEPVFFWLGIAVGLGAAGKAIFDAARGTLRLLREDESSSTEED